MRSQSVNGSNTGSFSYDNDSLLTGAGSLSLTRDPQNGLLTGTTLGSVTDSWTYNSFGEPTGYSATASGAAAYSVTYTRDKLGRITDKGETLAGVTASWHYAYDDAGRLTDVQQNSALVSHYEYDANGNRTRAQYPLLAADLAASYDDQDRMLTYGPNTYTYTANGELASKTNAGGTTTYNYDVLGNLRSVTLPGGTAIEYVIDSQNRRIGKKVNGTLTQGFCYDGQLQVVAELDGSGNVVSRFVYGDRGNVPSYMVKGGVTYRILADQLGSPRLVVNTANGAIVQRIDYDEFGNIVGDTSPGFQPFAFAGGLHDQHTRLIRFGARDYDPSMGRWTSKDPLLFSNGAFSLYEYASSDPINMLDPLGLSPCPPEKLNKPNRKPKDYWERVYDNWRMTNEGIPGLMAPPIMGTITAGKMADAIGGLTFGRWALSGFAPLESATAGGLGITATFDSALTVAGTTALNWAAVGLVWEAGVYIGSMATVGGHYLADWIY